MRIALAAITAAMLATGLPVTAAAACGGSARDLCAVASGAYRIVLPVGVETPAAMVWLHGWGGSANGVMKNRAWVRKLTERGYALIAPDGRVTSKRWKNKNWSVNDGNAYRRDDVAFLAEVVADAIARHGIDPDRVLLSGFSRGASMVWDAACRRPGLARAYAPVAGAFWEPMFRTCAGPVDLFHTHGWTDRTVPLEGRPLGHGAMMQGDVFQSLALMRATDGCTNRQPDSAPIDGAADIWQRSWSDCASGKRIDLMLHPGSHGVPKGWLDRALDWFEARLAAG